MTQFAIGDAMPSDVNLKRMVREEDPQSCAGLGPPPERPAIVVPLARQQFVLVREHRDGTERPVRSPNIPMRPAFSTASIKPASLIPQLAESAA